MTPKELARHFKHEIEVAIYGEQDSVTVECVTCCEVLFEAEEEEAQGDVD